MNSSTLSKGSSSRFDKLAYVEILAQAQENDLRHGVQIEPGGRRQGSDVWSELFVNFLGHIVHQQQFTDGLD